MRSAQSRAGLWLGIMAGLAAPTVFAAGTAPQPVANAAVPTNVAIAPNSGHKRASDSAARWMPLMDWLDQAVAGQLGMGGGADPVTQPAEADSPSAPATQPGEESMTQQEKLAKAKESLKQLFSQMKSKDWASALPTVNELETLLPKNPDIVYNKACILARLGQKQEALVELKNAIDDGFVDADHIKKDDDLQSLHSDAQFQTLVEQAAKSAANYSRYPYEKGADLADVKTVEADPAGGLRYRVRMSKSATAAHPDRLVIWFHPSGGSMDNVVEGLAPELAKHHLALVVFTQKSYLTWTSEDVNRLSKSMDDIGKIPGIDAKKPIAIGFSAGGQMMLEIYNSDPSQFGAMVLDAAYPVSIEPTGKVNVQNAPPKSPAITKTPLLVFVGGDDGGSQVWKMVEQNWREKGVPLDLNIIPDRKHEWLIDNDDRRKQLVDWLTEVAAGKLPGAQAPTTHPGLPDQQPQ